MSRINLNHCQNDRQNRGQNHHCKGVTARSPVKSGISAHKGSDLLLPCSNNNRVGTARPQTERRRL